MKDTLSLIPQIFYDFLARIFPGSAIIALFPMVVFGPKIAINILLFQYNELTLPLFWQVALWLQFAYVIGLLLGEIHEVTIGKLCASAEIKVELKCKGKCIADYRWLENVVRATAVKIEPKSLPRDFAMHDHLRDLAPSDAARLLKVRAERRLCQVLILGCSIFAIVNLWYIEGNGGIDRIVMEGLLIVTVIFCWTRSRRLHRLYVNGITNSWLYHTTIKQRIGSERDQLTKVEDSAKGIGAVHTLGN